MAQINQCRGDYNRLGFGYQIGFVRLLNRLPTQQPFEVLDDLLTFVSVQLQIDKNEITAYHKRQPTISQHQVRILDYLKLEKFGVEQREVLRQLVFEEACRLEQRNTLFLLRKFSPAFLECLELEDSRGTNTSLTHATELLREMNATNKRKVPEDAPTEFVSKTIRPLVVSDGVIDKP
jgi:hypothetical protein